ncbi:MAG: DUF2200 family protein, partial [Bacteroidota bacterium]
VEKKGRTKEELDQVITWLTGYKESDLQELTAQKVTFETFFREAALRACSGFSRRVKNGSFFAIFHLFSVT